jgi:hypothetical protein
MDYDILKNTLTLEEQLNSPIFYKAYLEKRNLVDSKETKETFIKLTTIIEKIKSDRKK